jgi:hypothetical protein
MRASPIIAGFSLGLLLLTSAALAEQKDCTTLQGASYQKCVYDNQEDTIRQLTAAYKDQMEMRKQPIKTYVESQINAEDYAWKDMDLQLQWEISDRQLRISQLESANASDEEIQKERNALAMIQKIRSLTSTSHGNKIHILQMSRDELLQRLSAAPTEYELQLRRNAMPSL